MKMHEVHSSLLFGGVALFLYFVGITTLGLVLIPEQHFLFLIFVFASNILVGFIASHFVEEKMMHRLEKAEKDSIVDQRTGLSSARYLSRRVFEEMHYAKRNPTHCFSLIIYQMQGLKAYLHTLGDESRKIDKLRDLTGIFLKHLRPVDVAACLNDESFLILTRQHGEGRDIMVGRLGEVFQQIKAEVEGRGVGKKIDLEVRTFEYPEEREIIREFLEETVQAA